MSRFAGNYVLVFAVLACVPTAFAAEGAAVAVEGPPEWAYPLNRDGVPKKPPDDGVLRHVPDSFVGTPLAAITDRFAAVDWHPDRHPPMPESVAHGRKPDVYACGFCHYPNGQGRPENASLAGLSAAYIIQQVQAMRDGQRRSAQPAMLAPNAMQTVAAHATADEVGAAAAYFASLRYKPWIRVVEADAVPKTMVYGVSMLGAIPNAGTEPVGERIIEVPENLELTELRDDGAPFVAYVPQGSIAKGGALVHAATNGRAPCGTCHGVDLKGTEIAPALAGRSPSYLFRQLYDIRQGTRTGPTVAPMVPQVGGLSDGEMVAITAYLASLRP